MTPEEEEHERWLAEQRERMANYAQLSGGMNGVRTCLDAAITSYGTLLSSIKSGITIDGQVPCEGELNANIETVKAVRTEIDGTIGRIDHKANSLYI